MQVETFEVVEVDSNGKVAEIDRPEEVTALIDKLGLDGQRKFIATGDKKTTVIPYRKIKADEAFVYRMICPVESRLCEFGESLIPLRVLQVAAHAKECGLFNKLLVWHVSNADVKDPVLIGYRGVNDWSGELYILARWGEVLEPFEVLRKKATEIWRAKCAAKLRKVAGMVQRDLEAMSDYEPIERGMDPISYRGLDGHFA